MSIISFDENPYAAHLAAPLTTVTQPNAEMGDVAVRMLFEQIQPPADEPSPQARSSIAASRAAATGGVLLPARLIVRRSVRKLS